MFIKVPELAACSLHSSEPFYGVCYLMFLSLHDESDERITSDQKTCAFLATAERER